MLKTLAVYLPQFHRVPENDAWWGEGFTEWTAVKGAEPLFEGHNQPRVPLDNNYYDLLEHDTMAWQADLMIKYCVDGMCIYHYWFEDGRRILEKPAENLLKWKDIQMPFCFYWANETWARRWEKLQVANNWSDIYEVSQKANERGILLKQSYGREKDWEEHFSYLLPFFQDERYIKIDNCPVFIIYRPEDVFSLWDMADFFNTSAKKAGFQGIYFIGAVMGSVGYGLDAVLEKQPDLRTDSYDKMWEMTLTNKIEKDCKTYFCANVDYDSSPRHGNKGFIMKGASPEKFYRYFKQLYKNSLYLNNDFVFINAWNEWGEGMYIGPKETHRYGYLEALRRAVVECRDEKERIDSKELCINFYTEEEVLWKKWLQNSSRYSTLLHNWLCLKELSVDFSLYFQKYGYHRIAIYGIGRLGVHLLNELCSKNVTVCFGIDKNNEHIDCEMNVYHPDQKIPEVDAVVITIISQYREISKLLRNNMKCPMIMIEEIVQELMLMI